MPERERRIFVPKGESVRLVLEGGSILDISHPASPATPFRLEQRSPDAREAQREQLKAQYAGMLLPYVSSRLTQHGYKALGGGGEEIGAELTTMEHQVKISQWMEEARNLGISNQAIKQQTKDLLNQIHIGASRMGETSSLVKGINDDISILVDTAFGAKKKKS